MNKPPLVLKSFCRHPLTLAVIVLLTLSISGAAEAASNVRLGVPVSYSIRDGLCTLKVHRVTNYSRSGTLSGPLSLQLWVTKQRYRGKSMPGFKIAHAPIGRLHGRRYFNDIKRVVRYDRPPGGRYFVVLLLLERGQITSYLNFPSAQQFAKSRMLLRGKSDTESAAQTVAPAE